MSDNMTDEQVRAELERIDPNLAEQFDIVNSAELLLKAKNGATQTFHMNTCKALCLLAELHAALGEIAEDEIGGSDSHCPDCIRKREIARKHWKGGK